MMKIEVVEPVSQAYHFVWQNRAVCLRYAAFPYFIKLACYAFLVLMGMQDQNTLRQGLFLLPSFFAEGVVVCFIITLAVNRLSVQGRLNETLPGGWSVHDRDRIVAGTILYVLIQMSFITVVYLWADMMQSQGLVIDPASASINGGILLLNLVILFALVWAVRLAWLYVPVTLGYSLRRYMRTFKGLIISFYMMGIMLMCTIPVAVVMIFAIQILGGVPGEGETPSMAAALASAAIEAFAQVLSALLGGIAMAYALYPVLSGAKK